MASMPVRPRLQAYSTTESHGVPPMIVIFWTGPAVAASPTSSKDSVGVPPAPSPVHVLLSWLVMPCMQFLRMTPGKPSSRAMVLAPPPRMKVGRSRDLAN